MPPDPNDKFYYTYDKLKLTVDRVVLVLVGAPRAVGHYTWIKRFVGNYKNGLYPDDKHPDRDIFPYWGHIEGYRPKFDVIIVQNSEDTPDRYLYGEDPRLAGLDAHSYAKENKESKKFINELYKNQTFKLDKDKWEKYHSECWDFADSLNFHYVPSEKYANIFKEKYDLPTLKYTTWHNQFLHLCEAYHNFKNIFDLCTENSVVIRQRMDMMQDIDLTFWELLHNFLTVRWSNKKEKPNHTHHHQGFKLSPMVGVNQLRITRGHITAGDEIHLFDHNGIHVFGNNFLEWMLEDRKRIMPQGQLKDTDNVLEWSIPEGLVPSFCHQHNYTFNELSYMWRLTGMNVPPLMDQWRYEWYPDWTPAVVDYIRKRCN